MIFNASNMVMKRVPSMHTSVGRYLIFSKKAATLLKLNGNRKISFKIENGEMLIYHDNDEGVLPHKTKTNNYRINSKKLIACLEKETNMKAPKFEINKLQDGAFELVLKQNAFQ